MEATPVPIPNTEVKLRLADGTAWETVWESRSLPAFIYAPSNDVSEGPFRCKLCLQLFFKITGMRVKSLRNKKKKLLAFRNYFFYI